MARRSTTGELVQLTRDLYDALWDLDVALSALAPHAVYEAQSLGTTFEGAPAIRGFLEDWRGGYTEYELTPEEIVDLGNGVVFAAVRLSGLPRGGAGSPLERRRPFAFVWADGQIVRITAFSSDVEEGRAAAQQLAAGRG